MRGTIAIAAAMLLLCGALFAQDMGTMSSTGTTGGMSGGGVMSSTDTTGGMSGGGVMTSTGAAGGAGMPQTITATVQNANPSQKTITIKGPRGNSVMYTLNDNTIISTPSGQKISVAQLQAGTQVAITYTGTFDNPTVTQVTVTQGAQQ